MYPSYSHSFVSAIVFSPCFLYKSLGCQICWGRPKQLSPKWKKSSWAVQFWPARVKTRSSHMKRWIKSPCHTLLFVPPPLPAPPRPLLCWHAEAFVSHPLNCTLRRLFLVFPPKASQAINSPTLSIIAWSKGRLNPGTLLPLALVLAYLDFLGVVACGLLIELLQYCKRAEWNQLEINLLNFSLSLSLFKLQMVLPFASPCFIFALLARRQLAQSGRKVGKERHFSPFTKLL